MRDNPNNHRPAGFRGIRKRTEIQGADVRLNDVRTTGAAGFVDALMLLPVFSQMRLQTATRPVQIGNQFILTI